MTADHFVSDASGDVGESKSSILLGQSRMIDHLEQQVAQFIGQSGEIALCDRVGHLIGFLDRVGGDGGEALFAVPGAAVVAGPAAPP